MCRSAYTGIREVSSTVAACHGEWTGKRVQRALYCALDGAHVHVNRSGMDQEAEENKEKKREREGDKERD